MRYRQVGLGRRSEEGRIYEGTLGGRLQSVYKSAANDCSVVNGIAAKLIVERMMENGAISTMTYKTQEHVRTTLLMTA